MSKVPFQQVTGVFLSIYEGEIFNVGKKENCSPGWLRGVIMGCFLNVCLPRCVLGQRRDRPVPGPADPLVL